MGRIYVETRIRASILDVFDMARSVEVHCQTASFTDEHAVEPGRIKGLLEFRDLVTFEARHLGWRRRLTAEIVEFERPFRFVDEMRSGVFTSLRHVHEFEQEEDFVVMKDVITWQSPWGVLGSLADAVVVKRHLASFLVRKQENLRQLAESRGRSWIPN